MSFCFRLYFWFSSPVNSPFLPESADALFRPLILAGRRGKAGAGTGFGIKQIGLLQQFTADLQDDIEQGEQRNSSKSADLFLHRLTGHGTILLLKNDITMILQESRQIEH